MKEEKLSMFAPTISWSGADHRSCSQAAAPGRAPTWKATKKKQRNSCAVFVAREREKHFMKCFKKNMKCFKKIQFHGSISCEIEKGFGPN
jgi:hypothetical protein